MEPSLALDLYLTHNSTRSDLSTLRAFSVQHDMLSSYRFSTITPTLIIRSGDADAAEIGCITIPITPDFGATLRNALAFVPMVILILVGVATVTAAMYSPGKHRPFPMDEQLRARRGCSSTSDTRICGLPAVFAVRRADRCSVLGLPRVLPTSREPRFLVCPHVQPEPCPSRWRL